MIPCEQLQLSNLTSSFGHFPLCVAVVAGSVYSVDHISGEDAIADLWWDHYELILNCIDQSKYKNKITTTLCNNKFDSAMHIYVAEVAGAIKNLKKGKSSVSD